MTITHKEIADATGLRFSASVSFSKLALVNERQPDSLSFIDDPAFLPALQANDTIGGVFLTQALAENLASSSLELLVCPDPRWAFYSLFNFLARKRYEDRPSEIDPAAEVHPTAFVSAHNVKIGPRTIVGPKAVILADVQLGADCCVGAGSVLGCDNAEVKKTSQGLLKVFHDGELRISDHVDIGANCTIDKGFSFRDTVIGAGCAIANTTFIGHGAHIGEHCLLLACSILGSATINNEARINPGAVISNQVEVGAGAIITAGAVVVRDVAAGQKVSGNFAVDHNRFLYHQARYLKA
ncbi:MAG: hypothetical protein ACPGOV_15070 [Magnetovibrionaceae bacterium]